MVCPFPGTPGHVSRVLENYQYNPVWGFLADQSWVRSPAASKKAASPHEGSKILSSAARTAQSTTYLHSGVGVKKAPRALRVVAASSCTAVMLATLHSLPGTACLRWRARRVSWSPDYIGKDLDAVADQLIERYPATGLAG
jgi:hypothetical protein